MEHGSASAASRSGPNTPNSLQLSHITGLSRPSTLSLDILDVACEKADREPDPTRCIRGPRSTLTKKTTTASRRPLASEKTHDTELGVRHPCHAQVLYFVPNSAKRPNLLFSYIIITLGFLRPPLAFSDGDKWLLGVASTSGRHSKPSETGLRAAASARATVPIPCSRQTW